MLLDDDAAKLWALNLDYNYKQMIMENYQMNLLNWI